MSAYNNTFNRGSFLLFRPEYELAKLLEFDPFSTLIEGDIWIPGIKLAKSLDSIGFFRHISPDITLATVATGIRLDSDDLAFTVPIYGYIPTFNVAVRYLLVPTSLTLIGCRFLWKRSKCRKV